MEIQLLEVSLNFSSESEDVSISKVVAHLKLFPFIFYLKNLEYGKVSFESAKFGGIQSSFEPFDFNRN
jgi:hypothetical protein